MRTIQQFLIFSIAILSLTSCETLKELAEQKVSQNLTCIPVTGATYQRSYQYIADTTFESSKQELVEVTGR